MSLAHQNILSIKSVYERFIILNSDFEKLSEFLESEHSAQKDNIGLNLLPIHALISKLNDFKHETMYQVKDKSLDVIETLNRYFKKLEKLNAQFDVFFWEQLCPNILTLGLEEGDHGLALVGKIIKIIELEESRDSKTLQLQQALSMDHRKSMMLKMTSLSNINRMHAEREIKHYRRTFFNILKHAISTRFKLKLNVVKTDSLSGVLAHLNFIHSDLGLAKKAFSIHFPESYLIMDFLVMNYHKNVYDIFREHVFFKLGAAAAVTTKREKVRDRTLKLSAQSFLPFTATIKTSSKSSQIQENSTIEDSSTLLTGSEILDLLGWVRSYEAFLSGELDLHVDELEPNLLESREPELLKSFVDISRKNMKDWLYNMILQEEKGFSLEERKRKLTSTATALPEEYFYPDSDSSGKFTSASATILFQIVNQILDAVIRNGLFGKLLSDCIREVCRSLSEFQKELSKMLDSEFKKIIPDFSHGQPDAESFNTFGLEYFLVMMANNSLKWIEFMDQVTEKIDPVIDSLYKKDSLDLLGSCNEGFVSLTKQCTLLLVDIVLYTIKPLTSAFFTSAWYKGATAKTHGNDKSSGKVPLVSTCVVTIEDFLTDFQDPCGDFIYLKLVNELMDRFILTYIIRFKGKSAFFKKNGIQELLEQDLFIMKEFFSNYASASGKNKLFRVLQPVEKIQSIVTCSMELLFMDLFSLVKTFPDIPLTFVEEILLKREDVESTRVVIRELMENVQTKMKEENIVVTTPTLFSRMVK